MIDYDFGRKMRAGEFFLPLKLLLDVYFLSFSWDISKIGVVY